VRDPRRASSCHTSWRVRGSTALAIALLLLVRPAMLEAQRFTCEEAGAILLLDDAPRLDLFSAASTIMGRCGTIAAGAIATALRRAAPNSTADTLAMVAAMNVYDRRLADSIGVVALDSSQSTTRRTLYLRILVNLAYPGMSVDVDAARRGGSALRVDLHRVGAHHHRAFGTRMMRAEDRARAIATIARMGIQDPDEDLRQLARVVAVELDQQLRNNLFERWPP
jgi:hypothetical protein